MAHFAKKFKLLIDRISSFFAKREKQVEKTIHHKKNKGHRQV